MALTPPGPRDPRQSFDRPPPDPVSIEDFAKPPPSRRGWLIAAGVLALVALVFALALRPQPQEGAAPRQTSGASDARSSPGAVPTSIPFEDVASGVWTITGHSWNDWEVRVSVEVRVERGRSAFSFFAYGSDLAPVDPEGIGSVDFPTEVVAAGQTYTGELTFVVPPGRTTIYLADEDGVQITALEVPGP